MKIADGELRQLLVRDLKLPAEVVREMAADARQKGESLFKVASASRQVDERRLARAYAKRLGVPFVDLEELPIEKQSLYRLPYQIANKYRVVCFDETPTGVKVAMDDPRNEAARKAVHDYFGKTVRRYMATNRGMQRAMRMHRLSDPAPLPLSTRELVLTIIEQGLASKTTELHLEPHTNELVIMRREGRSLQIMSRLPMQRAHAIYAWLKVQAGVAVSTKDEAWQGRFDVRLKGATHTIAVNGLPALQGERLVLRIIPAATSLPSLTDIGFSAHDTELISSIITNGRGLVIVAGSHTAEVPTTLARIALDSSRQSNTSVATVEDPLSFQLPSCTQTEVSDSLSYDEAVVASIAQGPSALVVPRLGASTICDQLVDYALSQHLVVSGLYASSLESAVRSLRRQPILPALIAASLRLIIMQHQLDELCSTCRVSFVPTGPLKQVLQEQLDLASITKLYRRGPGCHSCTNGSRNTVLAYELLQPDHALQQLLATGADDREFTIYLAKRRQLAKQLGRLAHRGHISVDQATALLDLQA